MKDIYAYIILSLCVIFGMSGAAEVIIIISNSDYTQHHQINFTRIAITHIPSGNPINETSLISSTSSYPGYTILHLADGISINQTNGSIKAGQSVNLTYVLYQPICVYKIYANGTLYNGTLDSLIVSNKYNFTKISNEECDNDIKSLNILGWELIK